MLDKRRIIVVLIKTLLAMSVITLTMLLLITIALFKLDLKNTYMSVGIVFIYILANIAGGYIIGKIQERRRLLWGGISGITYFAVILIISFFSKGFSGVDAKEALLCLIICLISGMFGGFVS